MSSEKDSYTSNICHQVQVSTTYVVSLLHSRIPCNCLAERAVRLAQRNRCGLMRLTGFLKQYNSSLLKGLVISNTGHKPPSPWGWTCTSVQMKELNHRQFKIKQSQGRIAYHTPFFQNCMLTITTVFTIDDIPNHNSCFRAGFYYGEFLLKRAPCLSRPSFFTFHSYFTAWGGCAALT